MCSDITDQTHVIPKGTKCLKQTQESAYSQTDQDGEFKYFSVEPNMYTFYHNLGTENNDDILVQSASLMISTGVISTHNKMYDWSECPYQDGDRPNLLGCKCGLSMVCLGNKLSGPYCMGEGPGICSQQKIEQSKIYLEDCVGNGIDKSSMACKCGLNVCSRGEYCVERASVCTETPVITDLISNCVNTDGQTPNDQPCICKTSVCDKNTYCMDGACSRQPFLDDIGTVFASYCPNTNGNHENSNDCKCGYVGCTENTGRFCYKSKCSQTKIAHANQPYLHSHLGFKHHYLGDSEGSPGPCFNTMGTEKNDGNCQCGDNYCDSSTGYFCTASISKCTDEQPSSNITHSCARGTYRPAIVIHGHESACYNCPKGQYNNETGAGTCHSCPVGYAADQTGSETCTTCPQGKVPLTGRCGTCRPGQYFNAGKDTCDSCPNGKYQDEQDHTNTECKSCPWGKTSVTDGDKTKCSYCQGGKYFSRIDIKTEYEQNTCSECSDSQVCQDITERWADDDQICAECPAGKYTPDVDVLYSFCYECGAGRYQDSAGKTTCNYCPSGYGSSGVAATECELCPAGTYSDGDDSSGRVCTDCQRGRQYSLFDGTTTCEGCPSGWMAASTKSACQKYPAQGVLSTDGTQVEIPTLATDQYFDDNFNAIACPLGTGTNPQQGEILRHCTAKPGGRAKDGQWRECTSSEFKDYNSALTQSFSWTIPTWNETGANWYDSPKEYTALGYECVSMAEVCSTEPNQYREIIPQGASPYICRTCSTDPPGTLDSDDFFAYGSDEYMSQLPNCSTVASNDIQCQCRDAGLCYKNYCNHTENKCLLNYPTATTAELNTWARTQRCLNMSSVDMTGYYYNDQWNKLSKCPDAVNCDTGLIYSGTRKEYFESVRKRRTLLDDWMNKKVDHDQYTTVLASWPRPWNNEICQSGYGSVYGIFNGRIYNAGNSGYGDATITLDDIQAFFEWPETMTGYTGIDNYLWGPLNPDYTGGPSPLLVTDNQLDAIVDEYMSNDFQMMCGDFECTGDKTSIINIWKNYFKLMKSNRFLYCQECPVGTQELSGECKSCAAGTYENETGTAAIAQNNGNPVCKSCPSYYDTNGGTECNSPSCCAYDQKLDQNSCSTFTTDTKDDFSNTVKFGEWAGDYYMLYNDCTGWDKGDYNVWMTYNCPAGTGRTRSTHAHKGETLYYQSGTCQNCSTGKFSRIYDMKPTSFPDLVETNCVGSECVKINPGCMAAWEGWEITYNSDGHGVSQSQCSPNIYDYNETTQITTCLTECPTNKVLSSVYGANSSEPGQCSYCKEGYGYNAGACEECVSLSSTSWGKKYWDGYGTCAKCPTGKYFRSSKSGYTANNDTGATDKCHTCCGIFVGPNAAYLCDSDDAQACANGQVGDCDVGQGKSNGNCEDCSAGEFGHEDQCKNCPKGFYQDQNKKGNCKTCGDGMSTAAAAATTASACVNCAAGRYESSGVCQDCSAGTYQDTAKQTSCDACAAGRYSNQTAATTCAYECPKGTYSDVTGLSTETDCKECAAGKYSNTVGRATACSDECAAGQMTIGTAFYGGRKRTGCTTCVAGAYCPGGDRELCPEGTWSDAGSTHADNCSAVPGIVKNCYSEDPLMLGLHTSPDCPYYTCDIDYMKPTDGRAPCVPCREGAVCNIDSDESDPKNNCNVKFYNVQNDTACKGFQQCETGTYPTDSTWSMANSRYYKYCTVCSAKHTCVGGIKQPAYCTGLGKANGQMSYGTNAQCVSCPEDDRCQNNRIISNCSVGEYFIDPENDPAASPGDYGCQPCPAGYKCDSTNNFQRTQCDSTSKEYQDEPGQTTCKICVSGTVTSTSCEQCPAGKKTTSGGSCVDCTIGDGLYQDKVGQTECKNCSGEITPGSYTDGVGYIWTYDYSHEYQRHLFTGIGCQICQIGKYLVSANPWDTQSYKICKNCAYGKYQDQANQMACKDCSGEVNAEKTACVTACAAGTYRANTSDTNCTTCPANHICEGGGELQDSSYKNKAIPCKDHWAGLGAGCTCPEGTSGYIQCDSGNQGGNTIFCGDGICNGGETPHTCSADCGNPPPECGDGSCNGGENTVTCPADCGNQGGTANATQCLQQLNMQPIPDVSYQRLKTKSCSIQQ